MGLLLFDLRFNALYNVCSGRVAQEKETLDSFVKVNLLCGEKRVKKKTAVRKATNSPVWNEAMSFDIPPSSLASSAIEVNMFYEPTFHFLFRFATIHINF